VDQYIEWYIEYIIHKDRPGLLGDISSAMGMFNINITSINGISDNRRGLIIKTDKMEKLDILKLVLLNTENITITAFRAPKFYDRLKIRHGHIIEHEKDFEQNMTTFRFVREEIGILVDLFSELFKHEGHRVIGVRGMPRVGKTESIIAGCVTANKKWMFLSSTLLKQTIRSNLMKEEFSSDFIYIIDGIVSTRRANERHMALIREIMSYPVIKVIEHPDIFIQETGYNLIDFDYIIELKNNVNEEISYDVISSDYSTYE